MKCAVTIPVSTYRTSGKYSAIAAPSFILPQRGRQAASAATVFSILFPNNQQQTTNNHCPRTSNKNAPAAIWRHCSRGEMVRGTTLYLSLKEHFLIYESYPYKNAPTSSSEIGATCAVPPYIILRLSSVTWSNAFTYLEIGIRD